MLSKGFSIETYAAPEIFISTPDFDKFCLGETVTIYATETVEGYSYQWLENSVPINGATESSYTTNNSGAISVMVTDANACTTISNELDCSKDPISSIDDEHEGCDLYSGDEETSVGSYCNEIFFKNTTTDFIPNTTVWLSGDVFSEDPVVYGDEANYLYSKAGYYNVWWISLFAKTNGDTCLIIDSVSVLVPIAADFTAKEVCVGSATPFTDKSSVVSGEKITAWSWDFGDPSSGLDNQSNEPNPNHIFTGSGDFTVSLTIEAESGCLAYVEKTITVLALPDFDFSANDEVCEGKLLEFTANVEDVISMEWDFGDPASGSLNSATLQNVWHRYETQGNYDVSLSVTDIYGCQDTYTKTIAVVPNNLDLGEISMSKPMPICEGETVNLTAPDGGIAYLWSNGLSTQTISVKQAGFYKVTITDPAACEFVTAEVEVTLNPQPYATISLWEYIDNNKNNGKTHYDYYEGCYGQEFDLQASYNWQYSYAWSDGNDKISYNFQEGNILEIGTYEFTVTVTHNTTACEAVSDPFTIVIHPRPADFSIKTDANQPLCAGDPIELYIENPEPDLTYYWSNGAIGTAISIFESGQYYAISENEFGCRAYSDSIEVFPTPDISLIPSGCYQRCLPDTVCLPSMPDIVSYQWYKDGEAVPAPDGNIPDYVIEEEGSYYVELTNSNGCSAISEDLSIEEKTIEIKEGDPMLIDGQVFKDVNENGQLDSGEELMNDITIQLTKEGVIIDETLTNINGEFIFTFPIDSVEFCVIMPESLLPADYFATTDTLYCFKPELGIMKDNCTPGEGGGNDNFIFGINNICSEELYMVYEVCEDSYIYHEVTGELLFPGSHLLEYTNPGTGCLVTEYVDVIELTEYYEQFTLDACPGESVMVGNTFVLAGTSEQVNLFTVFGCDSIIYVTVNELSTYQENLTLNACTGTEALFDNQALPIGTVQDFEYKNAAGCDSIITVVVAEVSSYSETVNMNACEGSDAMFDGTAIPAGSSQDFTYSTSLGCDSIITVVVTEVSSYTETVNMNACEGSEAMFDGTAIPAGSSQDFIYSTNNGCDSIITVVVAEVSSYTETVNMNACEGSDAMFDGTAIPAGSSQDFIYSTNNGCDSIITVVVAEVSSYSETVNMNACEGSEAMFDGTAIPAGSSQDFTYSTNNGCDSIITVVVAEVSSYTETVNMNACEGSDAMFDGTAIPAGSSQDFTYSTSLGCDSIITVVVAEVSSYTETVNMNACEGSEAMFDGTAIPAGSSQDFTYSTSLGCDSILTVIVDEATAYNETMDIEVCDGQTTTFDNTEMGDGETQAFTYSSEAGCDSVITVNVQAMPVLEPIISTSKSCLNIANGIISIDNVSGGQAPYQYSIDGTNFQTQSTFENIAPGTYTLYVQDDMVCLAETEVTVGAIDAMDISEQELTMECGQDLLTLNALVNNLNDLSTLTFEWHDGTNSESTDIHTPGDYWVDISNECETIRQNFRVTEEAVGSGEPFMIPTAFTPNSDGINDTYCPLPRYKNMEVLSFDFQVYDRWGTRVFQTNSVNDCWDGLREGVDSELGVFVWFYTADVRVCGEDRSVFEKGNVTLIY